MKRICAALLVLCLLLGCRSFPAMAESFQVYVIANTLNVYSEASTSADVLGVLGYGESLRCTDTARNWAKVQNSEGRTGFCQISGLSTSDPNLSDRTFYAVSDGVPVYSRPDSHSDELAVLKRGAACTAVARTEDGDWYRLRNGSRYGYAPAKYFSGEKPQDEDSEQIETINRTAYVASETLAIYQKPDSTSKLLATIAFGQDLLLAASSDGWAQVKNSSGGVGYCRLSGLASSNPNKYSITGYACEDGVKVRKLPSSSAASIATLSCNDTLTVIALNKDKTWGRVQLKSGKYGYAKLDDLRKSAVSSENKNDKEPDEEVSLIAGTSRTTVYVADNTIAVYASPSTSSKKLATLSFGESAVRNGVGGGWSRIISSEGQTAYCKTSGLTPNNPNQYSQTLYAQDSGAKIYAGASKSASVLATVKANAKLTGVAISGDKDWIRVKNGSSYGYVSAASVSKEPSSEPAKAAIEAIIYLAKKQLGKPYVYGADGPSQFDCSSLTQYSFSKAAGVSLQRTAQKQGYDSRYEKIESKSGLKKGDLVFFNTNSSDSDLCDHVGIYLGSQQFIHASSAAGKVIISSMSSGYYSRTYSWGRRIL